MHTAVMKPHKRVADNWYLLSTIVRVRMYLRRYNCFGHTLTHVRYTHTHTHTRTYNHFSLLLGYIAFAQLSDTGHMHIYTQRRVEDFLCSTLRIHE